jgi:hypothetical protein
VEFILDAARRGVIRRLPYRMIVDYAPEHLPLFEDWLVRGHASAPGHWSAIERIPAHIRFRPKEHIRQMRTRSVESWTDVGKRRWRIGKRKASAYSLYLGPRVHRFPHEADDTERTLQTAVRYGEDVGGAFMAHRTPLIAQNRLWRSVVARAFIDASESQPLGKRTALRNDQARPTYIGRENAREGLLYNYPPLSDRDVLVALSGIEGIPDLAWRIAPKGWDLPDLRRLLRRNLKRTLYGGPVVDETPLFVV